MPELNIEPEVMGPMKNDPRSDLNSDYMVDSVGFWLEASSNPQPRIPWQPNHPFKDPWEWSICLHLLQKSAMKM